MNNPQEQPACSAQANCPPAAPAPPRYTDWISYATAVTQQAQSASQATR